MAEDVILGAVSLNAKKVCCYLQTARFLIDGPSAKDQLEEISVLLDRQHIKESTYVLVNDTIAYQATLQYPLRLWSPKCVGGDSEL